MFLCAMSEESVPILGTVTPGFEHYCPLLAGQLDAMWPGHAALHYALPAGRTAPFPGAIPTAATTWTGVLLAGLAALRERGAHHVFVLLEDHVPLWPCAVERIEECVRTAVRGELPCVFFTKWEWPWRDVVTVGGLHLARVPRDFPCYNQCQPAVWSLDYYASLLAEAVRRGIADPWTFERFALPDQPVHYVSDYRWPSRHCGYRRRGRVYLRALYSMKLPESEALRDALLRERFAEAPAPLRGALGEGFRLWGRLLGMPERFAPRPTLRLGARSTPGSAC
jgi:hypothetical protein